VKLSDVMSAAGLAVYAEVALVLFLAAFAGVAVKLWLQKSDPKLARLPLDEDPREGE
jgi:hypothetical protein